MVFLQGKITFTPDPLIKEDGAWDQSWAIPSLTLRLSCLGPRLGNTQPYVFINLIIMHVYTMQDVHNDIHGAQVVGMRGILVKTGELTSVWCGGVY